MTVYQVISNSNVYQSLLPEDESFWSTEGCIFDGRRKNEAWEPPSVYSCNPTLNILQCPNCLDAKGSEWVYGKSTGKPIRITGYSFYRKRFSESTIFKIPEFVRGAVFAIEGIKDPEDEFKHIVEARGLSGLIFQKVWEE